MVEPIPSLSSMETFLPPSAVSASGSGNSHSQRSKHLGQKEKDDLVVEQRVSYPWPSSEWSREEALASQALPGPWSPGLGHLPDLGQLLLSFDCSPLPFPSLVSP